MDKEGIYYECDYCGKEFREKEDVNEHELHCKKRPIRIRGKVKPVIDIWEGIKLGIGFGIGVTISSIIIFLIIVFLFGGLLTSIFSQII